MSQWPSGAAATAKLVAAFLLAFSLPIPDQAITIKALTLAASRGAVAITGDSVLTHTSRCDGDRTTLVDMVSAKLGGDLINLGSPGQSFSVSANALALALRQTNVRTATDGTDCPDPARRSDQWDALMLFNSYGFIFGFFPIVVAVYLATARKSVPLSIAWLAAASLVFYATGEQQYPWLLPVSVLLNYGCGRLIHTARDERAAKNLLRLGVAVDLAVLGTFKYARFLLDQWTALDLIAPLKLEIALPVGVSFYTFTQIAYLVDSYRERHTERDLLGYFLFVSYYPHLIAGPILHHKEMMPQFRKPRSTERFVALYAGLAMFSIGLAKKVLLADPAGAIASSLFCIRQGLSFADAWVGALSYTAQIYFDFSGYSDMALGISYAMGIRLPLNFNSPYKSTSIITFWRRWHITLSRFLRDYLYIALGGSRKGPYRRYLNLFMTMVLGGLWHGANWTFVLWGALHGSMLLVAHGFRQLTRGRGLRLPGAIAWPLTQVGVIFAWIPFRAASIGDTFAYWRSMLGSTSFALPDLPSLRPLVTMLGLPTRAALFGSSDVLIVVACLSIAWLAPNSQQLLRDFEIGLSSPGYEADPAPTSSPLLSGTDWRAALILGLLLAVGVRCIGGYSEFIYFHF
jgi:alginate O-acetyltransferase complex protein AlgI